MKLNIATSFDGIDVFAVLDDKHMLAHANVDQKLIAEAISNAKLSGTNFMFVQHVFPNVIGKSDLVTTDDKDVIIWAKRTGRKILSRMVRKAPVDTHMLTVGICKDDDGLMTMFTAFYGPLAPKEIFDPSLKESEKAESAAFWSNHALCFA